MGLGLWSWLHSLFIGDFPKPSVFRSTTSAESCHNLLWDDPYSSSGFCGLSYEEGAMAGAGLPLLVAIAPGPQTEICMQSYHCRKTSGFSRSAQGPHPVASLINGNSPFSIPGSYCEDHMERTSSPNSSPHSEDAEV